MLSGIDSVYARIRGIYERIQEIQKLAGSVYSTISIDPIQRYYHTNNSEVSSRNTGKTFQEVLQEVLMETKDGKESKINVVSKPEESWKEVMEVREVSDSKESDLEKSKFDEIIGKASREFGVPKELIKAVIKAESNFNPIAISHKNAMGLMQLIPSTAKEMGVEDVFDPLQNIMGGTKYLRMLLDRYNGNLFLALSAYNAGPERVDRVGGIPEIEETKTYVDRVIKFYKEYSSRSK
ncbi:MAG: lytic transglycosylase domain-containing protein [Brevinematia bacterium]